MTVLYFTIINVLCVAGGDASFAPQANLVFFEFSKYHKINKIQNGHLTAILKLFAPKQLIRSLADIAVHICQIKKGSDGNFFLKRANELLFVASVISFFVGGQS